MHITKGTNKDVQFLKEMLFEAIFWNKEAQRPNINEFFKNKIISEQIENWGRAGDRSLIAVVGNKRIGIAWYRLGNELNPSFGFIDSAIPAVGIAVCKDYRSKGIGRTLMTELINVAQADDFGALSLSVEPNNFSRKLYESLGFVKVGKAGTSWIYKLKLNI